LAHPPSLPRWSSSTTNFDVLARIKQAVRTERIEPLFARSPTEATALLRAHKIGVVVSDESMAGGSGSRFLEAVRAAWPDAVRIPLADRASLEAMAHANRERAIFRFLPKPLAELELFVVLRQALKVRQLRSIPTRLQFMAKRRTG
jgi:DNA-binding NtrC family response regulator